MKTSRNLCRLPTGMFKLHQKMLLVPSINPVLCLDLSTGHTQIYTTKSTKKDSISCSWIRRNVKIILNKNVNKNLNRNNDIFEFFRKVTTGLMKGYTDEGWIEKIKGNFKNVRKLFETVEKV